MGQAPYLAQYLRKVVKHGNVVKLSITGHKLSETWAIPVDCFATFFTV